MSETAGDAPLVLTPGTYRLIPKHASVRVKVAGLAGAIVAQVPVVSGVFVIDAAGCFAEARTVLDASGITAGRSPVERALKGRSGFDVERHPQLTFRSTTVVMDGPRFTMAGDLTMRGKTLAVTYAGEILKAQPDRIAAAMVGTLDRTGFGITVGRPLYARQAEVRLRGVAVCRRTSG